MDKKEQIKNRMLKHAAHFWGYRETEMDVKAFDPIVDLLTGALSAELELVNQKLASSTERIEERILEQLTPDVAINAIPAHAIIHARAVDAVYTTQVKNQVYHTREDENGTRDVFFSPADSFPIVDGDVKYLLVDQLGYQIDTTSFRDPVLSAKEECALPPSTVWLGIELNNKITDLSKLRFFFNWKNDVNIDHYLAALQSVDWYIEDNKLDVSNGFLPSVKSNFFKEYSQTEKTVAKVKSYYEPHFFRTNGFEEEAGDWQSFKCPYPKELEDIFVMDELAKLTIPLLWIRLEFPRYIPKDVLKNMECYMNAFPVINRKYRSRDFRLKEHANIIPLDTEFSFFDVQSVRNQSNQAYRSYPLTQIYNDKGGTYTLRREAVGKFRDRDARSLLEQLIDLMRDETDAFSAFNLTFLRTTLKDIDKQLSSLEQHILQQEGSREFVPYLFVKPKSTSDKLSVEYWEINGADANNLPAGLALDPYSLVAFQREKIYFLTSTRGGRDRLTKQQQKYVYKNALLSRDRIVTIEDVKTFCLAQLHHLVKSISIGKSYSISNHPKQGLIQVLEVLLLSKKGEEETLELLLPDLEKELSQQSSFLIPIVVKIASDE